MNTIKKTILGLGILTAGLASAQSSEMTNMLKVGINAGVAVPSNNASANVGFDIAYQHLITPGFGIGIASGYNHFFGKDNTVNGVTIKNNDFAVVPVAAMLRYYPQKTGFYLGTDLGYGFITGDDNVAEGSIVKRPDGGFYLKPEIGYHNRNWNFAVQYTKVFTGDKGNIVGQDYSVGTIGAGISYNFPLGK